MTFILSIQEACPALSLATPAVALSATDQTSRKLVQIAHDAGDDIARRGDWSKMIKIGTFTNGIAPTDFQRLAPGGSVSLTAPAYKALRGPLSSDQIRSIASFGATTVLAYGIQGGSMVFSRALAVGEIVEATYVSNNWVQNGLIEARRANTDTATLAFPYELLTKGIIWRFKRSVGLQYQDEMAEFEADLAFHLKQDRGVTV